MKTSFVQIDGKLVPKSASGPGGGLIIIEDIQPFVSPVDNSVVSSRAARREHNRRNQVEDVGNDPAFSRPRTPTPPQGVKDDVIRAFKEHGHLS